MWLVDGSCIEIIASLSFWDLNLVSELLSDRVAINLMYIEAVAEVTGRWGGGEGRAYLTAEERAEEKSE